jgi:3-oxoacyl-[acyl-carrier-protein] synthase II
MASTKPAVNPQVAITGAGVASALGRGSGPLLRGVTSGTTAFGQVSRFDTGRYRARAAAVLPGSPVLAAELARVIDEACAAAALSARRRASAVLLLALHSNPAAARDPAATTATGDVAAELTVRTGLSGVPRIYTTACVAASTAVADGAAMITSGRADVVLVAAGYLVDADSFAIFDAGRALARDGQVRPFSSGRQGLLLGDGVAAVVLESSDAARRRGAPVLARLAGWGRAGDAYHVCQPRPDGAGLARAIAAALARARVDGAEIGYIKANGSGTKFSDSSEAAALRQALGRRAAQIPVSSTKSVHGHALEASALLELVATMLAMRAGRLPVNAGFLGPDAECQLDLVLSPGREARSGYALSLNAAFGGANTALVLDMA